MYKRQRYESARVLTTVTSHVRDLPSCQGIKVSPSGRLPSSLVSPTGSFITGVPEVEMLLLLLLLLFYFKILFLICTLGSIDPEG